jgi:hypothetical protein
MLTSEAVARIQANIDHCGQWAWREWDYEEWVGKALESQP